jgi:hypothetical protein
MPAAPPARTIVGMSTATAVHPTPVPPSPAPDGYSLGRTPTEHARLRAQAHVREEATRHVSGLVGVPLGASCLDAGCGIGETMRVLAELVGPEGSVLGIDLDTPLLDGDDRSRPDSQLLWPLMIAAWTREERS